jgi:ElaB/YqjD/DUF883 family membrane-anchored ribosome-binding protein
MLCLGPSSFSFFVLFFGLKFNLDFFLLFCRAVKEIARIQRECVELNDLLSDIMSEVNAINAESSASAASSATEAEKTISSLDRVRTRMQTTATALTERTRWRSRTEQLEQAFAAGELATV